MFTRKIAMLLVLAMVLTLGMSVMGAVHAEAVEWSDEYIDVGSDGTVSGTASDNRASTFETIMTTYKDVITFAGGLATVTMVAIFVLNFVKLGSSSGNPTERQKCLTGLIWSGIAAALLGSVTLVVGVFYGMLKS